MKHHSYVLEKKGHQQYNSLQYILGSLSKLNREFKRFHIISISIKCHLNLPTHRAHGQHL